MKWDPEQDAALKYIRNWYYRGNTQVCHMFGYAGTGKTTLAKQIADDIGGTVIFMAFSGKAAHVLHSKGCTGARTIHSVIYRARDKSGTKLREIEQQLALLMGELFDDGLDEREVDQHKRVNDLRKLAKEERESLDDPYFILNDESELRNADLAIIDEVSMVDGRMGEDLLSFGTKILVLGDPMQLPPVKGQGYFTEGITPDIMLENVHRQARESPVLRLATMIRNGEPLSLGQYGDSLVTDAKVPPETVMEMDQVIVGKNKTRHACNYRMRKLKGFDGILPEKGDKLVCRRNNHDTGLLNGAIFWCEEVEGCLDDKVLMMVKDDVTGLAQEVLAHQAFFIGGDEPAWFEMAEAEKFEYGWTITAHVSQGSQWKRGLVFDESQVFRQDAQRWLYTAVTRFSDSVIIARL